jgi:hypothetical protein
LLISAIGVWLVARDVDPAQLGRALSTADYGWVLIGVAAIGATFFVRTWRWTALLQPIPYRSSTIMAALLVGQVLNTFLPLRAGDVTRSVMLGRTPGSSFERVLGSVAVEKTLDWLCLATLVLIVALVAPLPEWFAGPARTFGIVAVLLLVGLGLIVSQRERGLRLIDRLLAGIPLRWRLAVLERLGRLVDGMESLRQRKIIWRAGAWSALIWLLGIAANAAVMRAFGVHSWPAAMFLMAVLMVGVALPPSIAALGVFEALTVLALGAFDVPRETALAIGVTLHAVVFVPPIVCGSVLAVWEARAGRLLPGRPAAIPDAAHPRGL